SSSSETSVKSGSRERKRVNSLRSISALAMISVKLRSATSSRIRAVGPESNRWRTRNAVNCSFPIRLASHHCCKWCNCLRVKPPWAWKRFQIDSLQEIMKVPCKDYQGPIETDFSLKER